MSLNELYRRAVTFPGPDVPLAGLKTALEAVEEELTHACDQATVRLRAKHKREGESLHPEDRDQDLYELEVTVDQILPRVFRGGYILTLWSVFEVVVKRMAQYVFRERGLFSEQNEFKCGNFIKAMEKVYTHKLGIPAFPDAAQHKQLDLLRQLRNVLIHHNGSVVALPEALRAPDSEGFAALGLKKYTDLHEEFVIPTADFLTHSFDLAQTYLVPLSERVYAAVHPKPLEDDA